MTMDIQFRIATVDDVPLVLQFIKDLAEYEKMLDQVVTTEDILRNHLFGNKQYAEVVFAVVDGVEAGFVLFFHNFSTFLGKAGLYIEDLFVKPEYRGTGIGKKLLAYISSLAKERDCGRVEWWVLNWNPARKFYDSIGAEAMNEWTVYRLGGKEIDKLAGEVVAD